MKCIFSAIKAAISLILFTNIAKNYFVIEMVFRPFFKDAKKQILANSASLQNRCLVAAIFTGMIKRKRLFRWLQSDKT
jgi:phage antirepressor YoqD-like protein